MRERGGAVTRMAARDGPRQRLKILREVIEQSAKAGAIAASHIVEAAAAAVEKRDAVAGLAEHRARMFVPAAVALDAVNEDDFSTGRILRRIAAITPDISVAGFELLDAVSDAVSQGAPPCGG